MVDTEHLVSVQEGGDIVTREQRDRLCNIAGFFICDGTLYVAGTSPHSVVLAFYQNDLETLKIISKQFGESSRTTDGRNCDINHCLRYNGRRVFKILRDLTPYMWECYKKRDAVYLLEHADLWLRPMKSVTPDILAARVQVANSVNHPMGRHRAKPA